MLVTCSILRRVPLSALLVAWAGCSGGRDEGLPDANTAPPADARPMADGPGAAATRAPCAPGAVLCDDFESYATGTMPTRQWQVVVSHGTALVDATRARSGTKSLKLTIDADGRGHTALLERTGAPVFPAPGNVLWGRMMLWLDKPTMPNVHYNNVIASGTLADRTRAHYAFGGMYTLSAGYFVRPPSGADAGVPLLTDCALHSKTRPPEQRWTCFEWQFDGATKEMRFWIDGGPIRDLTVLGSAGSCADGQPQPPDGWTAPQFTRIQIGWTQYHSAPEPTEVWMDDVAIGRTRVGCPPIGP